MIEESQTLCYGFLIHSNPKGSLIMVVAVTPKKAKKTEVKVEQPARPVAKTEIKPAAELKK